MFQKSFGLTKPHKMNTVKITLVLFILCITAISCDDNEPVFKNITFRWLPEDGLRNHLLVSRHTTNNLQDVIPETVAKLPKFSIELYGTVPRLKKNSIAGIKNLVRVLLWRIKLEVIETGAFTNLENLNILKVKWNLLEVIQSGNFANLPISVLDLCCNKISFLENGAFANLSKLKVLNLEENHLKEFPSAVLDENSQLVELDLSYNRFNQISVKTFKASRKLRELTLSYNNLSSMDCFGWDYPKLEELDLSENNLLAFSPLCFKNMPNLRTLNLYENKLLEIKAGIFTHENLEDLDLSSNFISSIAPTAFQLPSLRWLNLGENRILAWNREFVRATPKLEFFSISSNGLEYVPDEAFNDEIFQISLSYNHIVTIPDGAFRNLKNLKKLYLSGNPLKNYNYEILRNVTLDYLEMPDTEATTDIL